jgi:anti-sigma-K factor RskA
MSQKQINQDAREYILHLERKRRRQKAFQKRNNPIKLKEEIGMWRRKFMDLDEVCQELIKENAILMEQVRKQNSN